jgi:hypothetical protein
LPRNAAAYSYGARRRPLSAAGLPRDAKRP